MADAALAALRAASCECTAAAKRFSAEQSAEATAMVHVLRDLFSWSTAVATRADVGVVDLAPLLPQLPTELIVEVLGHLDVRSLSHLACTCWQLYYGPPCPPRPRLLWRPQSGVGRTKLGDGRRRHCRQARASGCRFYFSARGEV
jgi:hypothetical protein